MKERKKWKQIKKNKLTGILVVGAGIIVLVNASGLQKIFDPENFGRFENQYDNSGEYDSTAGDGEKSDLADESEDGQDSADEETQRALKVAEEKDRDPQDTDGHGMADEKNQKRNPGEKNPNAFEVSDKEGPGGVGTRPGGGNSGSTGGSKDEGNGSGQGNHGGKPGDSGSNPGKPDDPERPDDPEKPDDPETWEDEQLKPRDPIETENGILVKLTASITRDYCRGDIFEEEDAQVLATFRRKDQTKQTIELPYGGEEWIQCEAVHKAYRNTYSCFQLSWDDGKGPV